MHKECSQDIDLAHYSYSSHAVRRNEEFVDPKRHSESESEYYPCSTDSNIDRARKSANRALPLLIRE